jgi:hypothetical protein
MQLRAADLFDKQTRSAPVGAPIRDADDAMLEPLRLSVSEASAPRAARHVGDAISDEGGAVDALRRRHLHSPASADSASNRRTPW